jgi:hypothetical protein
MNAGKIQQLPKLRKENHLTFLWVSQAIPVVIKCRIILFVKTDKIYVFQNK